MATLRVQARSRAAIRKVARWGLPHVVRQGEPPEALWPPRSAQGLSAHPRANGFEPRYGDFETGCSRLFERSYGTEHSNFERRTEFSESRAPETNERTGEQKAQEMIRSRLAIPAVLTAAALAHQIGKATCHVARVDQQPPPDNLALRGPDARASTSADQDGMKKQRWSTWKPPRRSRGEHRARGRRRVTMSGAYPAAQKASNRAPMTKDEESQGVCKCGHRRNLVRRERPGGRGLRLALEMAFSNWGRFLNGFVRL